MEVICLNGKGEAKHFALKELLPYVLTRRGCDRRPTGGIG